MDDTVQRRQGATAFIDVCHIVMCKGVTNLSIVNIQIKSRPAPPLKRARGSDEEVSSRVGGGEVACGFVVNVLLVGDHITEDERRVSGWFVSAQSDMEAHLRTCCS